MESVQYVFPVGTLGKSNRAQRKILLNPHPEEVFILPHVFNFPDSPNFFLPPLLLLSIVRRSKNIVRVGICNSIVSVRVGICNSIVSVFLLEPDTWVCARGGVSEIVVGFP